MKEADTDIRQWCKSSYSPDGSNCVEMAATPTTILVRDSKNPTELPLALLPATWADFASYVALRAG
ncbi:DUF397 domain-containing protein [Streptomyces sp. CB09001]|uniref:DUF397 domain-containing protein n=1 Tax=unclassified Streptomyces TaxID=2593676 RepID=UPI000E2156B6|nr:DUF397 domain-containing protein [Streptomyces sp. CB09001]AXL89033.1 DUF397 domain-containing protein [Streptomyces sp. CB09001]